LIASAVDARVKRGQDAIDEKKAAQKEAENEFRCCAVGFQIGEASMAAQSTMQTDKSREFKGGPLQQPSTLERAEERRKQVSCANFDVACLLHLTS
jgi:hypothetical protein